MSSLILTGAMGGGLLAYGISQYVKSRETADEAGIANGEGWVCMVLGSLLLLSALMS